MDEKIDKQTASGSEADQGVGRRTLTGFAWMSLGTGGQAAGQFLFMVVLARLLTPEDFGVVAAALVIVGFSNIFSQLGIGPAVVQRLDLRDVHLRAGFTFSIVMGSALMGLVQLTAPAIAWFFHTDQLIPVLRVMAVAFPVQALGIVSESLLQRNLLFRRLALAEMIAMGMGFGGVGVALGLLDMGVWALVGGYLAQYALKTILLLILQPHPVTPTLDKRAVSDLMFFGGGFTLARISNFFALQGDNLIVGRWLGPIALGIYGRAYQLMVAPAMMFGQVMDRVLFPAMARVQERKDRLEDSYRKGVTVIALFALPLSVVLIVLAPELILLLLGGQWTEVVLPFRILAAGLLFRTSYKMSDTLARATGAVYRRAWRQAVYAVLVIVGAIVGQIWGLPGVAAGVVLALAVNFILMAHLSLVVSGMAWRAFLAAHLPATALTVMFGVQVAVAAGFLRRWDLPPSAVLAISGIVLVPSLLLVRRWSRLFLGEDGLWVIRKMMTLIPSGLLRRGPRQEMMV